MHAMVYFEITCSLCLSNPIIPGKSVRNSCNPILQKSLWSFFEIWHGDNTAPEKYKKTMALENLLASIPVEEWVPDQVVVFDWFDGPREGVARMHNPPCEFFFGLLAERYTPDDLDDRLFGLSELPPGSVAKLLDTIHLLGEPVNEVWVPVWQFPNEVEQSEVERETDRLLSLRRTTNLVIWTKDMRTFLGCSTEDREVAIEEFLAVGTNAG
jgi:hypothetical protein